MFKTRVGDVAGNTCLGPYAEECIALAEALGTCGTQAVCDVLAGYPRCRNLQLWRCGLGDGGLDAVTTLVAAAAKAWSRASKLRLLDLSHDGRACQILPATSSSTFKTLVP